jgi:cell division GTPase FtsZ
MVELVLFGVGAAGNKAAIEAIEARVINEQNVKLINTTVKDIPDKYKNDPNKIIKFSSMLGGCGKEPIKGHKAMMQAIRNKDIDFASIINPDTKAVVLATSIEGGTGCGATPVIAKYFTALNIPVHVFAFIGFQDEPRGIANSLKFFKELPDGVILHTIENNKFLDFTKNYAKAEQAANEEFVKQLEILIGSNMIPSTQNIDDTDHYKIITTPGYMDIRHVKLNGAKNMELTNQAIIDSFESMSCLEYTNSGCKLFAVIINASQKTQDVIDNRFDIIKRYTGESLEKYRHIQNDGMEEYMDIIIAGLPYPEDAIKELGKKYKNAIDNVVVDTKGLSDIFDDIDFDDDLGETNIPKMRNPEDALSILFGSEATDKKPANNNGGKPAKRADNDMKKY